MPLIAASDSLQLLPRGTNSNGTTNGNLSSGAVIVIVLVGAGFLVLVGFATTRFWMAQAANNSEPQIGGEFSQAQYMRDVRLRNQEIIEQTAMPKRHYFGGHGGGNYAHGGGAGQRNEYGNYASGGYDSSGLTSPGYNSGARTPAYAPDAYGGQGMAPGPQGKGGPYVNERRMTDEGLDAPREGGY